MDTKQRLGKQSRWGKGRDNSAPSAQSETTNSWPVVYWLLFAQSSRPGRKLGIHCWQEGIGLAEEYRMEGLISLKP